MKHLASVAFSFFAISFQSSLADTQSLLEKWHSCQKEQAAALDDHISDASTIAKAVATICQDYYDDHLDELTHYDDATKARITAEHPTEQFDEALVNVLIE